MTFTRRSPVDALERVFSCLYLGLGLFGFGWQGAIVLLAFWIEEIIAWGAIAVQRRALIGRLRSRGLPCGDEDSPDMLSSNALYGIFAVFHLVMILVYVAVDAKTNPGSRQLLGTMWGCLTMQQGLIDRSIAHDIGWMTLPFVLMGALGIIRGIAIGSGRRRASLKALDERNRVVMSLPHLTVILGIFALSIFPGKNWIAICLLAGKCLCELILLPATEGEKPGPRLGNFQGPPPGLL